MSPELSGEPEAGGSCWIELISNEFYEEVLWGRSQEKLREDIAESLGHNQLGRWYSRANRSQPTTEGCPDRVLHRCRQTVEQSLGDQTDLHMKLIGLDLAAHLGTILSTCPMEILVA